MKPSAAGGSGAVGNAVTIINVDPSGLILSQNDIPMPAGTFVPTGVTFLRDLLNSVFVVCDGTSEGVLIPNAY